MSCLHNDYWQFLPDILSTMLEELRRKRTQPVFPMKTISLSDAAFNLDRIIKEVCAENGQTIEITREHQPSVVLIGKQQYAALLDALDRSFPSDERSYSSDEPLIC